jgi:hypothetical protein
MSRRVGLRLVPDRVADDLVDAVEQSGEHEGFDEELPDPPPPRAAHDDQELPDQPPALGATAAATPSR